jgi:hypothetical protein
VPGTWLGEAKIALVQPPRWATITAISPDTGVSSTDALTKATTLHVLGLALPSATVVLFAVILARKMPDIGAGNGPC